MSLLLFLQNNLNSVKDHWNTRRIGKSRFQTIHGRPNVLYEISSGKGGEEGLNLNILNEIFDQAAASASGRITRRLSRIFQLPNGSFWAMPTWDLARDIIVVHRIKTHGKFARLNFISTIVAPLRSKMKC